MNVFRFFNIMREALQRGLIRLPFVPGLDAWIRAQRDRLSGRELEVGLLRHIVDPSKDSVDVGAHRGIYTYWLRKYSRHVFAYEPSPGNFRFLAPLKGNVTARMCALSKENGTATFRLPVRPVRGGKGGKDPGLHEVDSYGGTLHPSKDLKDFVEISVETRRLDDEGLRDIGFMKIEAEGHEMEVVEGARQLIARERPVMQIAIKDEFTKKSVPDAVAEIEALGYVAYGLTINGLKPFFQLDPAVNFTRALAPGVFIKNFIFFPRPGGPAEK